MIRAFIHKIGHVLVGRQDWLYLLARLNLRRMGIGNYELAFRMFVKYLPQDGLVLDIGANLGVMSAYLAKQRSSVRIISIEPIPFNVQVIRKLMERENIRTASVVETALSDHDGFIRMMVPEKNGVVQHGLAKVISVSESKGKETFSVPATTIDQIMQHHTEYPLVGIKLDVENHEWEVLNGGLTAIRAHRPLILAELWDNEKKGKCIKLLESFGYKVMVLDQSQQLISYDGRDVLDYFFIPESKAI